MIAGHPEIILFQPEIPQNTGNIARLAAGTGCRLHLITPLGFAASDKQLRRAGLDYWPFLDLEIHDDLDQLLARFPTPPALLSKKATRPYWEIPPSTQAFVFGRETSGLPPEVHSRYADFFYQIPMFHDGVRSQNLGNAVSIVIYDRIRQLYAQSPAAGR